MESQHDAYISRHLESDGIIISTRNTCSAAVGLSLQETELEKAEREHTCGPETLDLWKMFGPDRASVDTSLHATSCMLSLVALATERGLAARGRPATGPK